MVFQSNQHDVPGGFGPSGPFQSTGGPSAPLPPSRRQRDTDTQWIVVLVAIVFTVVTVALVLGLSPSKRVTPAPRAPSTYSQHECGYEYLDCDDVTTPGFPR